MGLRGASTSPGGGRGWSLLWGSRAGAWLQRGWAAVSKWTESSGCRGLGVGTVPRLPQVAVGPLGGVRAEAPSSCRPPARPPAPLPTGSSQQYLGQEEYYGGEQYGHSQAASEPLGQQYYADGEASGRPPAPALAAAAPPPGCSSLSLRGSRVPGRGRAAGGTCREGHGGRVKCLQDSGRPGLGARGSSHGAPSCLA